MAKKSNAIGVTAQTQFFHMFKVMFDSGDVVKMGSYAFTVYAYIKSCANYNNGESFPSTQKIAEQTGLSRATVFRALTTLREMNYITSYKKGRFNVYRLNEQIPLVNSKGEVEATASWEYVPKTNADAVQELKDVLTGSVMSDETKLININKLQIIISNVESGGTQNIMLGDSNTTISLSEFLQSSNDVDSLLVSLQKNLQQRIANTEDVVEVDKLSQELNRLNLLVDKKVDK